MEIISWTYLLSHQCPMLLSQMKCGNPWCIVNTPVYMCFWWCCTALFSLIFPFSNVVFREKRAIWIFFPHFLDTDFEFVHRIGLTTLLHRMSSISDPYVLANYTRCVFFWEGWINGLYDILTKVFLMSNSKRIQTIHIWKDSHIIRGLRPTKWTDYFNSDIIGGCTMWLQSISIYC